MKNDTNSHEIEFSAIPTYKFYKLLLRTVIVTVTGEVLCITS